MFSWIWDCPGLALSHLPMVSPEIALQHTLLFLEWGTRHLCVLWVFFPFCSHTHFQFSGQPSRMSLNWCWSRHTSHCWLRFSSSLLSSLQQHEACLPGPLHLSHTLSIGLVPVLFLLPDKFPWTVPPSQDAFFVSVAKERSPWVTPPILDCFISFCFLGKGTWSGTTPFEFPPYLEATTEVNILPTPLLQRTCLGLPPFHS